MKYESMPMQYPIDSFHNLVRDAVYEVGRFTQAPDALVANAFLTAMSIACQGQVDVKLPTGQVRPVSLNIATIANSGERKTAVDSLVCEPIYKHDAATDKVYVSKLAGFHAREDVWKTIDAALRDKVRNAVKNDQNVDCFRDEIIAHSRERPSKPVSGCIIRQDITERALMDALQGDGRSIAIMSDEGELVLKAGAMQKLGALNKAWDGAKSLTLDRAKEHIRITNPRVTISFMVQADVFAKFMDKRDGVARASGHLARYLVAYPGSTQGTRRTSLEEPVWNALHVFHRRMADLLKISVSAQEKDGCTRSVLSFSPEAKERWVQVCDGVEERLGFGGDLISVRDFGSKSMEIASRVAAILHYFTSQEGNIISLETLDRAFDITGWHLEEFKRLFGRAEDEPQVITDARSLRRYLCTHVWCRGAGFIARNDVRQCGPIRHHGRFVAALDYLCQEDSIWVGNNQGKRKRFIYLNDYVFNQLAF